MERISKESLYDYISSCVNTCMSKDDKYLLDYIHLEKDDLINDLFILAVPTEEGKFSLYNRLNEDTFNIEDEVKRHNTIRKYVRMFVYNKLRNMVRDYHGMFDLFIRDTDFLTDTEGLDDDLDAPFNLTFDAPTEDDEEEDNDDTAYDFSQRSSYTDELLNEWTVRFSELTDDKKRELAVAIYAHRRSRSGELFLEMWKPILGDYLTYAQKADGRYKYIDLADEVKEKIGHLFEVMPTVFAYNSHKKTCLRIEFESTEERSKNDIHREELDSLLSALGWTNGKIWAKRYMYEKEDSSQRQEGTEVAEEDI